MHAFKNLLAVIGAVYVALAVLASLDLLDVHTCISNAGKCPSYQQDSKK